MLSAKTNNRRLLVTGSSGLIGSEVCLHFAELGWDIHAESFTGKKQVFTYVDENRIGDHICYYSDLRKMKQHFPSWDIRHTLTDTIGQIVQAWKCRDISHH